jgi:hypothetical protein
LGRDIPLINFSTDLSPKGTSFVQTIELDEYPLEEALAYLAFSRLRANKEADFALNLRFLLCSRKQQFDWHINASVDVQ